MSAEGLEEAGVEGARSREGLLAKILVYGASRGIVRALLAVRGLVLAVLLGPTLFGAWALFRLAMPYAALASLGIRRGLEFEVARETPNEGSPRSDEELLVARTTLGYTLAVFGALGLGLVVASQTVSNRYLSLGMLALGIALPVRQVWMYGLVYLRSRGHLRRFAVLEVINAALHATFAVLLALRWGLGGAFAGFVLASVGSLLLLRRSVPLRPALSRPRLRRLLKVGLPLSLVMITATVLATVDQWVVAVWGGTALLGYYAFGLSVAGFAQSMVVTIRTVIFPEVYARAHQHGPDAAARQHLQDTLIPFAWLYPPFLGFAALAIGPAVDLFVPQYMEAVPPARLFIFTAVASGFTHLGSLGVIAGERQRVLPAFSGVALLLNLGLSVLALASGGGLAGVAAAALLSRSAYGYGVLIVAASVGGIVKPGVLAARALLPTAYCAAAVYFLGRLIPGTDAVSFALQLALFSALLLPLAPFVWRELSRLRRQRFFSLSGFRS